jgi:hypothetical protein
MLGLAAGMGGEPHPPLVLLAIQHQTRKHPLLVGDWPEHCLLEPQLLLLEVEDEVYLDSPILLDPLPQLAHQLLGIL